MDSYHSIGNEVLLNNHLIAVFCSAKCPGSIILKTYEYMKQLKDENTAVISGFHSPIEHECLNILMNRMIPVILSPARSIENMRINKKYTGLLAKRRMLIVSPFNVKHKRISSERSKQRNEFITDIADEVFIPFAASRSKTEELCKELIDKGRTVLTFNDNHNENLIALGVTPIIHKDNN